MRRGHTKSCGCNSKHIYKIYLANLTGQKFGKLTVIERAQNNKKGRVCWKCVCECGNEKIIAGRELRSGDTKSCGCLEKIDKIHLVDLTGQKFGKLTVIERAENGKWNNARWKCVCECGNEKIINSYSLRNGTTKSCGCILKDIGKALIDLTGQKFGRLTVIERAEKGKHNQNRWKCKCDCGNETIVSTNNLRRGHTKSCGCIHKGIGKALVDLTGQKFGRLTVIERAENNKEGRACWKCVCECGNEKIVTSRDLNSGGTKSCGCAMTRIDLTGQKFGRLTVIERAEKGKHNQNRWKCKCDCGNEKIVNANSLRRGRSKSCGCLQRDLTSESFKKEYGVAAFNTLYLRYQKSAIDRGLTFLLTEDEFKEVIFSSCYYCGKAPSQVQYNKFSNGDIIYNGIDRIDNSKGYFKDNVKPCCRQCNFIKYKYSEEEFTSLVKAIYEHLNLSRGFPTE